MKIGQPRRVHEDVPAEEPLRVPAQEPVTAPGR